MGSLTHRYGRGTVTMLKGFFTPKVQRRKDEVRRRGNDPYRDDDNYQHQNNRSGSISPPGKGRGREEEQYLHNQSVSPSAFSGKSDYDIDSYFKHLEELIKAKADEANTHLRKLQIQVQKQNADIQLLN